MSFKAALKIEGRNINLLYADFDFVQHINKDGFPGKYPQSGFITLIIEASADNFFLDWMLSATAMKSGSLFFFKRDNMSKMKELTFSDAYCVGFREKFSHTGEHPFFIEVKLSAGEMRYGESSYKNPWFVGGGRDGEGESKETEFVIAIKDSNTQSQVAISSNQHTTSSRKNIESYNANVLNLKNNEANSFSLVRESEKSDEIEEYKIEDGFFANSLLTPGILVEGTDKFIEKTLDQLKEIQKTKIGKGLIEAIYNSNKTVLIVETAKGNSAQFDMNGIINKNGEKGKGSNCVIKYNPLKKNIGDSTKDWMVRPPIIGLAHELIHAAHAVIGNTEYDWSDINKDPQNFELQTVGLMGTKDGKPVDYTENDFTENKLREELKLPRRLYY